MSEADRIQILVVDDHFIVRMGLGSSINSEPDMLVVGEAADGQAAIERFRQLRPDVTLMDLRLPGLGGVEATEAICSEFPAARIIVLTISEGDEDICRAFHAGARGYLLKTLQREELQESIRAVHAGKRHVPSGIAALLTARLSRPDLTGREMEILQRIVAGKSNKEIAVTLQISEITVKRHVSNLLDKLQVCDRTQAATAAIQRGIVHLE